MAESFADIRRLSREPGQDKASVIERKRGGTVPSREKQVGLVTTGKAAEREMRAMEDEAAKAKPAKPAHRQSGKSA